MSEKRVWFNVRVSMIVDDGVIDSPEAAAAQMDAWLRDAERGDVVYTVESSEGSFNRVIHSGNDGWKVVDHR
jgi:predicted transcriptional regulator